MVMSHTSNPAMCKEAAISLSPLEPSSLITATRGTVIGKNKMYTFVASYGTIKHL